MTTRRNGLLLVLMQPPAALEEEFNAWYDTEHIPERAALPGFQTAIRFVAPVSHPRYMAIYDLDSPATLDSSEYRAVSGANFSPWTKRVTSRVQVTRIVAEQVYPGGKATGRPARLALLWFRDIGKEDEGGLLAALRATFEQADALGDMRLFTALDPAGRGYLALIGLTPPPQELELSGLGPFAGRIALANLYQPYRPIP